MASRALCSTFRSEEHSKKAFGQIFGWFLHFCFGIGSYLIIGGLAATGIQLFRGKKRRITLLQSLYFFGLLASVCILLNLIEDTWPLSRQWTGNLYANGPPGPWYHLGGAPLAYLYHDFPIINLSRILNRVGTAIVFSSTLLACLLLLTRASVRHLAAMLVEWWRHGDGNDVVEIAENIRSPSANGWWSRLRNMLRRQTPDVEETATDLTPLPPPQVLPLPREDAPAPQPPPPGQPPQPEQADKRLALPSKSTRNKRSEPDYTMYKVPPSQTLTSPKKKPTKRS